MFIKNPDVSQQFIMIYLPVQFSGFFSCILRQSVSLDLFKLFFPFLQPNSKLFT